MRLCRIYQSLGDEQHQDEHARAVRDLEEELELQCGACSLPLGFEADSLEALPCAHILHARYLLCVPGLVGSTEMPIHAMLFLCVPHCYEPAYKR